MAIMRNGAQDEAHEIKFDSSTSTLSSTNVQDTLVELVGTINADWGVNVKVLEVTNDYTLGVNEFIIIVDNTGTSSVFLPDLATSIGRHIIIKRIGSNHITIIPYLNDEIDGDTDLVLQNQYSAVSLVGSTSGWNIF